MRPDLFNISSLQLQATSTQYGCDIKAAQSCDDKQSVKISLMKCKKENLSINLKNKKKKPFIFVLDFNQTFYLNEYI